MRSSTDGALVGKDNGDNKTVESKSLTENEDENHTDVNVLLGVGAHTGITSDTEAESGSEGGETAAQASGEVTVAVVAVVGPAGADGDSGSSGSGSGLGAGVAEGVVNDLRLGGSGDTALENDGNNEAVDTKDTSHNDGDEGLVDELTLEDTDGGNSNASLSGTVGGAKVAEDKGGSNTHESEEGVLVGVVD